MKSVLVILKSVVTPIFIIFLCLAGVTASIVSFAVEYFTLEPLLTLGGDGTLVKAIPIALIITIVLETTKNGCCIVLPALKEKNQKLCRTATVLWWLLMIFSLLCTAIYTTNTLYSDVVTNSAEAVAALESTLDEYKSELSELEQKVKDLVDEKTTKLNDIAIEYNDVNKFNDFVNKYTDSYKKAMDSAKATQDEVHRINSKTYVTNNKSPEDKAAAVKAADDAYESAKEDYNNATKEAEAKYNEMRDDLVLLTTENYDKQISDLNDRIEVLGGLIDETKNKITSNESERLSKKYASNLNVFLTFLENLVSSQTVPHARFYQISVIIISFLVAITLEVIIRFTNTFIGQSLTELSEQLVEKYKDDELTRHQKSLKDRCETFLELFIKAVLCCGVYFITYMLFVIINNNQYDLGYLLPLALLELAAYFIIQWIISFLVVKEGNHTAVNYTPSSKVGTRLNDLFGTENTINNVFKTITKIYNCIPKWIWSLLVYMICPIIAHLFFSNANINNIDDFIWQLASAIVTFLFGSIITKSEHTT